MSTPIAKSDSLRLGGWRHSLFSRAKFLWGFGLAYGYLAIVSVPLYLFLKGPTWIGPCSALGCAIVSRVLYFFSSKVHSDAQWLLRQTEFERGLGWAIDSANLAALQSRYPRIRLEARGSKAEEEGYYEYSGPPSPLTLVKMLRESAWWSEQLATKATIWVGFASGIVVSAAIAAVIAVARVEGSPIAPVFYALAVCLIVCLDTVFLAMRYRSSATLAKKCFDHMCALTKAGHVEDDRMLAAVGDYQLYRADRPLIPDWFKKVHEKTLQEIWDRNLSLKAKQLGGDDQG